ncbi:MAG: oxalurate catabolism protein HpxZ [Nevskia sp.]|nr:oxalurate catabolism protein HpxZ [Nevskia sp.]
MEDTAVNIPDVLAELRTEFERYEAALLRNDVPVLNDYFWNSAETVRYGLAEHSLGIAAVHAARAELAPVPADRRLQRTVITTFGRDAGSVSTEFQAPGSPLVGRQTQTWIRFAGRWRIVAAHVSTADPARLRRY